MLKTDETKTGQLGTFSGVFTPSILTILGIILFLRLGYVVGSAGLARALIIIAVANCISVLTSFSLAAIATNMKVKGGGDYYLISRTLGIEFGGAIGIVLFLAQSVSIAFYCIGFGEAVSSILGGGGNHLAQVIAGTALVFLFALAWVGADLATKFQYVVMVFLVLALISFFIGGIEKWDTGLLITNWTSGESKTGFWILFALFFPAVTGFTQGVSMSGDLKDAGKSLPSGTFSAVALSIIVYFSVAVIFAASNPLAALSGDYGVMKKTALFGPLIDAGVIAATLSSAMASFLGAPRILQSLASDKIFPVLNPFAKGYGENNNPRRGVLFSFGIAFFTVMMGQLDLIAGVVSMFFLISYGLLNYATYYEAAAESPSFRPRFKWYDKRISLAGFVTCLAVMLAIDFKTGIAAAAILFAIFQYLKRTSTLARWADSRRSYQLKIVRDNLIATQQDLEHPRDWRPYVLALSNDTEHMLELLKFSSLMEGKSGMTAAVRLIRGRGYRALKLKEDAAKELKLAISEKGINAFPLSLSSEYISNGLSVLFQSFGIGPIQANTILLNWNEKEKGKDLLDIIDYKKFIRLALQSECNIVMLDHKPSPVEVSDQNLNNKIDVWWDGSDTSNLMILLAYLITRDEGWEESRIRLLASHMDQNNEENILSLKKTLEEIRIQAEPKIILGIDQKTVLEISGDADLVFIPVSMESNGLFTFEDIPVENILPGLKTVTMTMAAQKIDLDTEPEEGKAGELAILFDELKHAEKRVETAEEKAHEAAKAANDYIKKNEQESSLGDPQIMGNLKEALLLRKNSEEANKNVLRERAKLIEVSERAKDQGLTVEEQPE